MLKEILLPKRYRTRICIVLLICVAAITFSVLMAYTHIEYRDLVIQVVCAFGGGYIGKLIFDPLDIEFKDRKMYLVIKE